jgi:hypothetical protein
MGRLVVQYPGDAGVLVDGVAAGRTNRVLQVAPGRHVIRLTSNDTEPAARTVQVALEAGDDVVRVGFAPAPPVVERTSALHARTNGVLLGQCLSLACLAPDLPGDADRWAAAGAFLHDVDPRFSLPARGPAGGASHAALLAAVIPRLAAQSRELADFTVLGGLLTQYGARAGVDPSGAAALLAEIERLRVVYDLPPADPHRLTVPSATDASARLAPGLAYLREIVERMPVEPDTALVLGVPASATTTVHAVFCRPTLEHCGFRAIRAWSGIDGADAADLLLAVIARVGLVWADVSTLDPMLAYQVGAAHALGKLAILVARADAEGVPASLGYDAVIRYDTDDREWPEGAVLLMAASLAAIKLAAARGDRLRVSPDSVAGLFDEVSQALGRILLPPEARDAQRRGRRAMDAGDLALAESSFDEAYRLGLTDEETRVWRGWARVGLGRPDEAAEDFDAVLGRDPLAPPIGEWRPIAAYMRGVLREAQGDLSGALHDVDLALALGLADPEVRERRDALAARVG